MEPDIDRCPEDCPKLGYWRCFKYDQELVVDMIVNTITGEADKPEYFRCPDCITYGIPQE